MTPHQLRGKDNAMSADDRPNEDPHVVVVGPGGMALAGAPDEEDVGGAVTDLDNQPAKVRRIGTKCFAIGSRKPLRRASSPRA